MSEREDGFYWVIFNEGDDPIVCEWQRGAWWIPGSDCEESDSHFFEIGPRVQRDSEVVRERDEAVKALQSAARKLSKVGYSGQEFFELVARIESKKSGVKP